MADPFSGKLCVVTGAASGIGRALALNLARRGAALALSDVNDEGLAETAALIGKSASNRMRADSLDVADADGVQRYAETVRESLGDADYIFNVAGLTRIGSFEASPLSSFEQVMDVNFWGVVRMSKAFLPQLIRTRGGIVNISSLFGLIGFSGQAHYCASKFAVRGFSESIAQELQAHGVQVTSVHPGGVATAIARNATLDNLSPGKSDKKGVEKRFDKAAITSAEDAAEIILAGAGKGKRRVVVGRDAKVVSFIQRLFPQTYAQKLRRMMPQDAL